MFSYSFPRWRKLVACAQFKIHNSLPVLPIPFVPSVPFIALVALVAPVPQFTIPRRLCFSIRLPSSSYLNVQPCHFFKWLTYCCFAPARHYPCLSSVLKRLPVLSLLRHCWLRSPKVAC